MSAVTVEQLEQLLEAALHGVLRLDAPGIQNQPPAAVLTKILCLAIAGAECRDHAAINPRGQVRLALHAADQRLRRFA